MLKSLVVAFLTAYSDKEDLTVLEYNEQTGDFQIKAEHLTDIAVANSTEETEEAFKRQIENIANTGRLKRVNSAWAALVQYEINKDDSVIDKAEFANVFELKAKYEEVCKSQQNWQSSFLHLDELLNNPSSTAIAAAQNWLDAPKEADSKVSIPEQIFKIILTTIREENTFDKESNPQVEGNNNA